MSADDAQSPPSRARSLRRRIVLSAAVFCVLCLCAEGVARVRFYFQHGTFLRIHTFATDPSSGLQIPVPNRDTGAIKIDSRGFRSPELDVPKPKGRVRLAFLGASTTFCAEASGNAATWPSLVTDAVKRAHPSASIDFVNAGVAGYLLADIAKNLEYRVKPLSPDVIVVYEATNDLTHDTRDLAVEQGVYTSHSDSEDWLAEISLVWHLIEKNVLVRTRTRDAALSGGRLALDPGRIAPGFHARLAALVLAAQKEARFVALATFSQRTRRDQTPREQLESCITHFYYMPYMSVEAVLDGFAAYNAEIRAVAAETGAWLIDGEDEIPGDAAHFADSVHFTDAGCRAMAQRVVQRLERAPGFQALFAH